MNCKGLVRVKQYIRKNEGLRLFPYKCSAGKTTIGVGRNLDDRGISNDESELMLTNDIETSINALMDMFGWSIFCTLSEKRQTVLIDLVFNLGQTRFLKFKKMIQAVKNNDFEEAAKQILESRYARQLPNRSQRNADMMREG